jgi:cytochrome c oxidase cbb3-type subunit 3
MKKLLLVLVAAVPLLAQHEATTGDLDDGRRLYLANCALCHGPEGNSVPGVELGRQIRRASTDDGIRTIIQKGIPGTAMPPHTMGDFQAGTVIAYLHFMAKSASDSTAAVGDAAHGKAIFEGKGNCVTCHRVRDSGSRLGPDLTDIGTKRRGMELRRSIVEPDAEVLPENRGYRIVTKDGTTINGHLLNQDAYTVQILDSKQRLLSYGKTSLTSYAFADHSLMPSFQGKLSAEELTDLVSYLVSLKGIEKQ